MTALPTLEEFTAVYNEVAGSLDFSVALSYMNEYAHQVNLERASEGLEPLQFSGVGPVFTFRTKVSENPEETDLEPVRIAYKTMGRTPEEFNPTDKQRRNLSDLNPEWDFQ